MARDVELSGEKYREIMNTSTVRKGLKAKADAVQRRAEQLGQSERVEMESEVTEGTRPRGRTYARVASANVGQEWGDKYTDRRRILGRAAESS